MPSTLRFAILCALVASCGTAAGWMPTNPPPRPLEPKPAEQVELFTAGAPPREFVEVGIVEAAPSSGYSTAGNFQVLQQLRTEGGRRGCDGLVVNGETKSNNGSNVNGTIEIRQQTAFRAACIVYR